MGAVRRQPAAVAGLVILSVFIVIALIAPWAAPHSAHDQSGPPNRSPTLTHPLGTDDLGVDMLSLVMWGARVSLLAGFGAALVAGVVGATIGIVAGYFGGWIDVVLMRVTDYFLVVPTLPLMIVVAALWGPRLDHTILVIGLLAWPFAARVIRSQVKSIRERTFVQRAAGLGASHLRIMRNYIVPQLGPLLTANIVLILATAVFNETALAFLGLEDPSVLSWGNIIEHAFNSTAIVNGYWWELVPPGIAVSLLVFGCSLLGTAIEHLLNPRLQAAYLSGDSFSWRQRELVAQDG